MMSGPYNERFSATQLSPHPSPLPVGEGARLKEALDKLHVRPFAGR